MADLQSGSYSFIGADEDGEIRFSVIIPAHNEEKYIAKCLDSIAAAALLSGKGTEVIVVLNRCSDGTRAIAKSYDCVILENDSKNLSQIRNSGARAARGDIVVTIDADSLMTDHMLLEIDLHLQSGQFIGGGVSSRFERMSLGIVVSSILLLVPMILKYGFVSIGIFWCYTKDFEAIGGFDEKLLMAEDADFANRLRKWGKQNHKKYGTIKKALMITSCRKFDRLGDWYLANPKIISAYLKGTDKSLADQEYYENQVR